MDGRSRRRKLSINNVNEKENNVAKHKIQILSKLFPKEANKQDSNNSRISKQSTSNGKSALLSDEVSPLSNK